MKREKRQFYVKFKIDTDIDAMEAMLLSEELETVNQWKGVVDMKSGIAEGNAKNEERPFQTVAIEFERSMNAFQSSVPFMMQIMPFMRRMVDDKNIRGFTKKHGHKLEDGEFELYQIGIDHIGGLNRLLEKSSAIKSGIDSLPRLFILGLISAYDAFLSQLIKAIFITKPEILSSSERNISFKELVEFGSVEAAREGVIEKEVEAVIRLSHAEQIEWLEKKLNMPLRKDLKIWPDFIEICERRNLFTHTNGVVSSQYIKICKEHGHKSERKIGDALSVDSKYYQKSVSIILEIGYKLTHVVWRKLCPKELAIAASELNEFAYRLIAKRRFKTAVVMFEFGLYDMKKQGSDAIKKRMIVNLANALKLSGDKARAEKILNEEDWSSSTDAYKICVAAVKDDVDAVVRMMKSVVDANLIQISSFRDWAVFEKIREESKFIEAFERIFGEKLLANMETVSPLQIEGASNTEQDATTGELEAIENVDKTVH